MHAGMGHTLQEVHRVLKSNGTLIDMRPHIGNRPVTVVLSYATLLAGKIDSSRTEDDKRAATQAMQQALNDGLYKLEHDAIFEITTELDSVDDLRDYGDSLNKSILPEQVIEQVENLIADEKDDFSIQIRRPISIANYRKL